MKVRPRSFRLLAGACGLLMVLSIACSRPVGAQTFTGTPSPAYGIAQRIEAESRGAWAEAYRLHVAGKLPEAGAQHHLAQLRAHQAINEYSLVVQSHMYGHTAAGAEALLAQARLFRDVLQSNEQAVQAYKTLHNNYALINFPDKQIAELELQSVAVAVDKTNRTTYPASIAYAVMDGLVKLTGGTASSYWLAIVLISVIVKLAVWPLSNKQYKSLKEMQKLQPHIKEVQAKYKNDKEMQGKKVMELYREHGINPMGGCGPMLVQIPIWYALVYTIRVYEYQFQHGSFIWIGSPLSHLYPQFFAVDLSQPDIPMLAIYALSMYVQMRMTVPADPQQAEQQRMMAVWSPLLMAYFFVQNKWPSAFLLYYLVFNLLSMLQQKLYMRSSGPAPAAEATVAVLNDSPSLPSNGTSGRNGRSTEQNAPGEVGQIVVNGVKPTAKGTLMPKVHPKKKRR
jgi:YidC/Oxa1 family membrane protein insertase